jgi:hypothetical protein
MAPIHSIQKTALLIFLFFLVICNSVFSQNILTQVDSIKIDGASIWGGISYDGRSINVTTMSGGHINLVKYDTALNKTASMIPITTSADLPSGTTLADHKHVFVNNRIYVTFSNSGDEDLFLFQIDTSGNRIGDLDTVALDFKGAPTNDMILTTDSVNLSVLHFNPGSQSWVYQYDFNLNKLSGPVATSISLPHNNIGNAIIHNGIFYLFTGDHFGSNASLVLTQWNTDWTPYSSSPQTILSTSGGDGKWFSTGVTYDEENERWYIGYQHLDSGVAVNNEHIDITVFDKNFNVEETQHVTESAFYRPHFLLLDGCLYMAYDQVGGVYIKKYKVEANSSVGTLNDNINESDRIDLFPNPSQNEIHVKAEKQIINGYELYNEYGELVRKDYFRQKRADLLLNQLHAGVYFIRIYTSRGIIFQRAIVY